MSFARWKLLISALSVASGPPPGPPSDIPTISPASGWTSGAASLLSGFAGVAPTADEDTERTLAGVGFPAQPNFGWSIPDWFYVNDRGVSAGSPSSQTIFIGLDMGNEDGFDDAIVQLEGATIPVPVGIYIVDGVPDYGIAFTVTGAASKWGWAYCHVTIRPKRGHAVGTARRIWLNTHGALPRRTYYVSGAGNNANAGTSAGTAWRELSHAIAAGLSANAANVDEGFHIEFDEGAYSTIETGIAVNKGPITMDLKAGASKARTVWRGVDAEGNAVINARRLSIFNLQVDTWGVLAFRAPRSILNDVPADDFASTPGMITWREGCDIRDAGTTGTDLTTIASTFAAARACGPFDKGRPVGLRNRNHRFWDKEGSVSLFSFYGTAANPVTIKTTHALPGARHGWNVRGEYAWSLLFPRVCEDDSNLSFQRYNFTGFENFWIRQHSDVDLIVSGPITSQVLTSAGATWAGHSTGSLTVYKVPVSNGADLPNLPPQSGKTQFAPNDGSGNGAIQIPGGQNGQWWAQCFNGGAYVNSTLTGWTGVLGAAGSDQYLDAPGPLFVTQRDGTNDRASTDSRYGRAVVGTEPGFVYLLNNPGTIDRIRVLYGHGNHWLFNQGVSDKPGSLRNLFLRSGRAEHPEAYAQSQGGEVILPGVNVTINATTGVGSFSGDGYSALRKGALIRITSGPQSGQYAIVRKVNSATSFNVYTKRLSASGALVNALSADVSAASCTLHRTAGGSWNNIFAAGSGAAGIWAHSHYNWIVRNSTIRAKGYYANTGLLVQFTNSGEGWSEVYFADSVFRRLDSTVSAFPSQGVQITNCQFSEGANRCTDGTGAVATALFDSALFTDPGVTLTASARSLPRDRNGALRTVGVTKIGSDAA